MIALVLVASVSLSQDALQGDRTQAYEIPFASKGNTIELTVSNTATIPARQVDVNATGLPAWVGMSQQTCRIDQLKGGQEQSATFTFSVDKTAPVNTEQTLLFTIRSSTGETWTKEIKIKVSPPDKFELFRNYPNPFNPTTTICYQLTNDSKVNLKVYNVIGQEVATLVDEHKQVGYHQEVFDATRYASGMYIYRIVYTDASGKQASDRKTMLLLK
jgi:hypothetical protein